jgi:hypothetical protein
VDKNYTVKQVGSKTSVLIIDLGDGRKQQIFGPHKFIADAEAAYARWQDEDDKRRNWHEFDQFTGAPG